MTGGAMKKIYYFMDRMIDPLPKEIRKKLGNHGVMLYYHTDDEDYKRYKELQYRKLIVNAALSFFLGLLAAFLLNL